MPLVLEFESRQHAASGFNHRPRSHGPGGPTARPIPQRTPPPSVLSSYPYAGALPRSSPSYGNYPGDDPHGVYQGASDAELFAAINQLTSEGPILLTRLGSKLNVSHDCRGRGKKWLVPLLKNNPSLSRQFVVFDPHEDGAQCSKCSRLLVGKREWFDAQTANLNEDGVGPGRSRHSVQSRQYVHEDVDSETQIFDSIDEFIGDTPSISVQLATLGAYLRRKHDLTGRGKKWLVPFLRQSNRFVVFDPHENDPDLRNQQLFVRRNLSAM